MTRSDKKKRKIFKEKEELPSFLKNITVPPEEFITPPKPKSKHYLGPIFFGDPCKDFQPPLHVLSLGAARQGQKHTIGTFKQSIDELFYDFEEEKKPCQKEKEFHPPLKRKKPFYDPYPHKCPGKRKIPSIGLRTPTGDFGTTTSVIEGETSMEIPLCRFRSSPICHLEAESEIEFIMPSDLREERWKYLSHRERISHAHFPKRFVTVSVNGPNIPASITITKLQCKRTREYDAIFLKKSEEEEKEGKVKMKTAKEEQTEAEDLQTEGDTITESEAQADELSLKFDIISTGTRSQKSVDVDNKEDDGDEGPDGKESSSKMAEEGENDGEGETENDKTEEGEKQEEGNTEEGEKQEEGNTEVEAQGEENPDHEEGD